MGRMKLIEKIETDTHKIVILGDTETGGKKLAEAVVTLKK